MASTNRTNKNLWNIQKIIKVTDILKKNTNNTKEMSIQEKYYEEKFDILEISGAWKIILKPKSVSGGNLIYVKLRSNSFSTEFMSNIRQQFTGTR